MFLQTWETMCDDTLGDQVKENHQVPLEVLSYVRMVSAAGQLEA